MTDLGNPIGTPHVFTNDSGQTITFTLLDYGLHIDTDETANGKDIPDVQDDPNDADVKWIGGQPFRRAST